MAAAQAFSSGSSSTYDVFLSFYGEDVRYNFCDHLYHALVNDGIITFRDEDELRKGKEIGPELVDAIQKSRISIPIFSKNYASSRWCLDELAEIYECSRRKDQIVMPIYYKVEPRNVRHQNEKYAKAFEQHQMRFPETTIQKWRNALTEIGELIGWHLKKDMYEVELINNIVKTIGSTLNKRLLSVPNDLVGIQLHIKEMLMRLDIKSNNRKIVGIHGLGGIGKTTIAKAVYNEVFHHFEGCSFIANVRETAQHYNGIVLLQKKLILDLKQENKDITSEDDGINKIQKILPEKKVLIVLDDVDQNSQVKYLVGDRKWFGVGSKIIITTRDKQILHAQNAEQIYEPSVMNEDDSLQLFGHHAFKSEQPPEDYSDLSKAMVETTGGLPLALEVIGLSLYSQGKQYWEDMVKKLQKVPNNDVMERLKISYDALDDEQQRMFLDTACFFIGMEKDIVRYIWNGCDFFSQIGLDTLCARSLVTISEKGELGMHDLFRELGRKIVYQENGAPRMRTRIWSQKDVLDVLNTQTEISSVEGLSFDFRHISRSEDLMSEGFAAMTRLRLLRVDYARFSWNFTNPFSELIWLSWKGCPDQYAQTNFRPRKLAVLDLSYSKITKNWMGWKDIKRAEKLKVLNLTSCHQLSSIPDISANPLLEVLLLKDCRNLDEIDISICCLTNLVMLNMSQCGRLKDLPSEICKLTSLQELNLHGCKSLKKLPEKLGRMISLTELDLRECKSLEDLPSEICKLRSLKKLNLTGCTNLKKLPEKFGDMISLIELGLSLGEGVVDFPCEISELIALQSLSLRSCGSLTSISCLPSSLTKLHVSHCYSIQNISVLHSTSLSSLGFWECHSIRHIKDLPSSLTSLVISDCNSMVKLSSTSEGLRNLKTLRCSSLEEIEGVDDKLDSLEVLHIGGCCRSLPKLRGSKNLRTLELSSNDVITDFEGGEGMESLEVLEILSCRSLRKIPYLRDSKRLRKLQIDECPELSEIEGLEEYESLQELSINGATSLKALPEDISTLKNLIYLGIYDCCYSMERFPDLSNLKELRELDIGIPGKLMRFSNFPFPEYLGRLLTEIPGLGRLESLRKLRISGCIDIGRLPDLSNLNKLNKLMIKGCKNLTEIHGIDRLKNLEILAISGCESLEILPDLSNLKKVKHLEIEGCENLTQILGVDRMEILEFVYISGCQSLKRLPDLSNLRELKVLRIECCKNLTEIHGVDGMELLEKLNIYGCESLERLPDLSNLKSLRRLKIEGSKNLTEIHGVDRLELLEKFKIIGCDSLERLPGLSNLKKLYSLKIESCNILTEIHGVDGLELLEKFKIIGCDSLERLPALSNLKKLYSLKIESCNILTEIQGVVDTSESLRFLTILDCESLEKLPDLLNLEELIDLWIEGCKSLERLSDLSNLKNLVNLQIQGCNSLTEIQGVDGLEFLQKLDISGCEFLEILPDLSNLKCLRELKAIGCENLTEIQAGNGLESLEELDVRGCISLEKLPDLTKSEELWSINGQSWEDLTDIAGIKQLLIDDGCTNLIIQVSINSVKL
ncbi:disease resistance protein RPV1-like [Telopea speciosissima]|uniref:disease resistance protein RPV1-like n=1 Tax=Telopea speciosissima TaxID=54955 RepID=UPI001CC37BDD|nr:disease resistance protein RPV1-like [Telopea speciosissima]